MLIWSLLKKRPPGKSSKTQLDEAASSANPKPSHSGRNTGLTKSPVEAGDQGACPSADPSSFVPSQDDPRSSAPFAGPQLDLEAALACRVSRASKIKRPGRYDDGACD